MSLKHSLLHLFHPRRSNNHRPRVLHPEALVYFCLMVIGIGGLFNSTAWWPSQYQGILGFASTITASQVVEQTNQQRANLGLSPLTVNPLLNQAALAKGQHMMTNQYWAHVSPTGVKPWDFIRNAGYSYSVAGENLARDFANTPDMMAAWMASPTHKANIVSNKYSEIGIAVIDGNLEGQETTLVVQMFGKPSGAVAVIDEKAVEDEKKIENEKLKIENEVNKSAQLTVVEEAEEDSEVLAGISVPVSELTNRPLFTPLQLTKAFFLSLIFLILMTLVYDSFIIGHKDQMRLVGQNMGHIIYFITIAFLLIYFKAGIIG